MKTYADFEVWISVPVAGAYPVRVFSSPAGPAAGELKLDLDATDFKSELALVRGVQQDIEMLRAFGQRLFNALFNYEVRSAWDASQGLLNAKNSGLRLRLWIEAPELAVLPWELLNDPNSGFIATSADTVLSRYLPVREPPVLQKQEKLRILVVVESPWGCPPLMTTRSTGSGLR